MRLFKLNCLNLRIWLREHFSEICSRWRWRHDQRKLYLSTGKWNRMIPLPGTMNGMLGGQNDNRISVELLFVLLVSSETRSAWRPSLLVSCRLSGRLGLFPGPGAPTGSMRSLCTLVWIILFTYYKEYARTLLFIYLLRAPIIYTTLLARVLCIATKYAYFSLCIIRARS